MAGYRLCHADVWALALKGIVMKHGQANMPKKKPHVSLPPVMSMSPRRGAEAAEAAMPQPASARNPFEDDVSVDLLVEFPWVFGLQQMLAAEKLAQDDWCIQAPEDIIQEAKRNVQVRRPDRVDDTDVLLKSKPGGDEDPDDKGVPIILPDNRVVSVELNRRLREELLGPVVFKERQSSGGRRV
eukprot:s7314_g1.t1